MYTKVEREHASDLLVSVTDGIASIAEEVVIRRGEWPPEQERHPILTDIPVNQLIVALGGRVDG